MIVNRDKCIGCTLCSQDCIVSDIVMIDKKATIKNEACLKCGHCLAICPVNAISTCDESAYSMAEVIAYDRETFDINPDHLLNFMKYRRSVRLFKKQAVEETKIAQLIETGRFTQTGGNVQDVSYVVVQDSIQLVRKSVLATLNQKADELLISTDTPKQFVTYAQMWKQMYRDFEADPNGVDKLFFHAPLLIIVKSKRVINGALAAAKMELMADALGLGTYFSGFLEKAVEVNPEIGELLQIQADEQLVACMVIGYPRVKYKRTVPRKAANVIQM